MARPSSVRAFLGSVEGLCLIESVLRRALRPFKNVSPEDPDTFSMFMDLSRVYLQVSEACDRKLAADLKAQREFEELKKQIEAGMTPEEIERTLETHFERRGWGSLDAARTMLFTFLTEEGLDADQAREIVANGLPKRRSVPERTPLAHRIRKSYSRMEETVAAGATALHEALAPSEDHPDAIDQEASTEEGGPSSDDLDAPGD